MSAAETNNGVCVENDFCMLDFRKLSTIRMSYAEDSVCFRK